MRFSRWGTMHIQVPWLSGCGAWLCDVGAAATCTYVPRNDIRILMPGTRVSTLYISCRFIPLSTPFPNASSRRFHLNFSTLESIHCFPSLFISLLIMALVSFLQNRKLILSTRIAQLSIAVAFFVLLCWVSTHRGPWNALNGTIAIGGKYPLPILQIPKS